MINELPRLIMYFFCLVFLQIVSSSCNSAEGKVDESAVLTNSIAIIDSTPKIITKVKDLSDDQVRLYATTNSCYLPLLKDGSLYPDASRTHFSFNELMNDSLKTNNVYRNRYLVGDFMVLDENKNSRGIVEKNPVLNEMFDFQKYDSTLYHLFDEAEKSVELKNALDEYIRSTYPKDSSELFNFYSKIWQYKTPPLNRKFAYLNGKNYATGQRVCLCEALEDTLLLVAQFAVSSKRLYPVEKKDSLGKVISTTYGQSLPLGNSRKYYGAEYRITSKNWETRRKYENLDKQHDEALGGGNNRVTYYKNGAQLPNFLLMSPTKSYPKATRQNGIHEVALRGVSRGMLGTPNSIGCIRVTNFGSKFVRWWSPQNVRFFVLYDEQRYFLELPEGSMDIILPFKNETEGNLFREWLNKNKPFKAQQLNIDLKGDFSNGFILDAYNLYGAEYEIYKSK